MRRRWWLVLVPVVVVFLAWLGRPSSVAVAAAASAASSAPPSSVASTDAAPSQLASQLDASADAEVGDDAPPASTVLPDGGVIVDLNRASESDLRRLSGIGPGRAKAILALRDKLGRFKTVDDLLRIKGFGKATLRRLRPNLRV